MVSVYFTILMSISLMVFYEATMYRLVKNSVYLYRINNVEVRLLDRGEENAIYVNTLLLKKKIILLKRDLPETILKHELGHVEQVNIYYLGLILAPWVASCNVLLLIPLAFTIKAIGVYLEYKADKAVGKPLKFNDPKPRPKSRLKRLYAWILENHPPDWVRMREDYLQKNIVTLFLRDILNG
ncbi:conjugal transfer protein [Sulfolobus acidocaldarius]|uniref:Conserved conjugative plasmid protein n=5 Tax=Sulfolobus acidocaldarius TaxID=2285 RepID=Q4JBB8_SULAC|nr:conserved conjugative plasmid protein [Sulfolobus acidocaldarius DSM 639]AGE70478.1 conjugative plasmid protein [Sulfolobus acidocaldarius N8]ALU29148.1 conjugal transfer protein [Sulfolobus acidocaldarius]ALU32820.1 conjugal transfer protein [Sulfolobus acidocaldarius]WCM35997.1 conjugal transfer protein [Sulfolobus acidocaldarius DSM 639]